MSGISVFLSQFYVKFRKVTLATGLPFKVTVQLETEGNGQNEIVN